MNSSVGGNGPFQALVIKGTTLPQFSVMYDASNYVTESLSLTSGVIGGTAITYAGVMPGGYQGAAEFQWQTFPANGVTMRITGNAITAESLSGGGIFATESHGNYNASVVRFGFNGSNSLVGGITDGGAVSRIGLTANANNQGTQVLLTETLLSSTVPFILPVFTTSTIPAAASSTYWEVNVSDATAPLNGSAYVGGGAVKARLWSNGTSWIVVAH